ncbi:hypothetical protein O181_021567 [Austropuccinia psidii MF-1]|uniref:Uncharacterized protein n=1 Tax=Austropuccinia psidii MF-1 TaxID=1389203 RepID=A0A9Q3CDW3_9BASI|nr:hypothetical protein [Austropuccinia psidii MF-1]
MFKERKIIEINIEKDDIAEENSDDKSLIFSEYSKDIENIHSTFDIIESCSHLPQSSNNQPAFSNVQDAQLMKTNPNRGKGYKLETPL